jgi:nitrogen fixation NifU-like protein
MSDLRDLYQEIILDHYRRPRHYGKLADATHHADGLNPLCGDKVAVHARIEEGVVREVAFEGSGCAISTASASLLTEVLRGKTLDEARALFQRFHGFLTGASAPASAEGGLGKLEVLAGVRDYPVRIKCATLAWHTFMAALDGSVEAVSTE